ncbi:TMV resistance protein N-like [Senna tora]|uniref:TMV resistance protein N-like n=1 Tax=Senna tora TaxID=362788 RepID=A0A834STH2_9FABA|nr:TMV resistance protein N-like [Senna tora]
MCHPFSIIEWSVNVHGLEPFGLEVICSAECGCGFNSELPSLGVDKFNKNIPFSVASALSYATGSDKIEAITLRLPKTKEVCWNGSEMKKMKNLKMLVIEGAHFSKGPDHLPRSLRVLEWRGYSSPTLPPSFDPRKLVGLNLSRSCFRMNERLMKFESLITLNLGRCNFLKEVPDLSGASNLVSLYLNGCKNLVEVHDSIGFLDKLERLAANGCTKLQILPCSIKSTSLQRLFLEGCRSLRSFPEILGKMKHLRDLSLLGFSINEFPFSFRNLVGLKSIRLYNFKMLHRVMTSIFTLPRLETLLAINCGCDLNLILGNGGEQERVNLSVSPSIRLVIFEGCTFPDYFLTKVLSCLPKLKSLFLRCSTFTILPACISDCRFLRSLVLDDCSCLREIKGIPPNIKYLSASNCTSLTCQSQSILLSQALHKGGGKDFCLPGLRIPKWFDHSSRGPTLSFWFRNKFPSMALCVVGVLDKSGRFPTSRFNMLINGIQQFHFHLRADKMFQAEHINLLDLQLKFYKGEIGKIYVEDGWNHVELSYRQPCKGDFPQTCTLKKGSIKWMGVYVYKQKTSMNNIRFSNPKLPETTYGDFLNGNKGLDLHCYPLQKKRQDMEACEEPDTQQWQVQRGGSECVSVSQNLWRDISGIESPPRIKILMWNICQDALPTYEYLFRRKLVDSPLCPICGREAETIEHMFLKCAWTQPIWFGSDVQWSVDMDSMHSFPVWFCQKLEEIKRVHPNAKQISALVVSICWAIWKGRNEFVLEDKPVNPMSALINLS